MRILATLVLAILAGTAVAATVENIIVKDGEHSYVNGNIDASYRRFGQHYAAFDLDGVRYVITDEATLETLRKAIEPEIELGKQQAEMGARQARLGGEQAKLGAEQARLGAKQISARDDERVRELSDAQRGLAEKQRELGEKQRELGEKQRQLGEKQRAVSARVEQALEKIFRNAVRTGVAQRP